VSESQPRRRPFRLGASAALRLALYFVVCWTVIGLLVGRSAAVAAVVVIALYTTFPLFVFLRYGGWPFYPGKYFRLWVLRVFWYAQLCLPLVAAGGIIGTVIGWPFRHPRAAGELGAGIVLGILATFIAIGYLGSRALLVRDLLVELPDLPVEFDGFRIAQLTDLHIGPHLPRGRLEKILREVTSLAPQMIAVTGDMIDDRVEDLEVYKSALGDMRAECGVFVIAGNHDVYAGWPAVEARLRRGDLGTLLVNEWREIARAGASIVIAGTGDPAGRGFAGSDVAPDIEKTLSGIPAGRVVLALAHNPALFPALADRSVALTLSGHTHWGQVALPNAGWSMAGMFLEDAMGIVTRGNSLLYISPGTGYWGIPFRIGATGEITHVTLRRSTTGRAHAAITGRRRVT
jgi:predicted MPP superfamily phosphohydrolase